MRAPGTDAPHLLSIQCALTRNQWQSALRSSRLDLSVIPREVQSSIGVLFETVEHWVLDPTLRLTILMLDRTGGLGWFDSE
jgi:hypothetical protein